MALQLDNEQKIAVESTGTNILVSASAGAGKTGVLVQRLKKRITADHIRVSRILAMTFTSAAADEMKKRLASELHSSYQLSADTEEKKWLRSQLIELESANITTIDSYCLTIIKKYFSIIGLDPATAQNILSSGSVSLYQSAAFHQALEELILKDEQKALRLVSFFSQRSENYDSLEDIIHNINAHAQSMIDPSSWYQEARDSYHHISRFSDLAEQVQDAFYDHIACMLSSLFTYLDMMEQYGEGDSKVDFDAIKSKRNHVTSCLRACREHQYVQYSLFLESLASSKTSPGTKENAAYKEVRKKMEDTIKKLLSINYDEKMLVDDHNDLTETCETLIDLSQDTWNIFVSSKQKDACMDFTDMERYAYDILNRNDQTVAKILQDSFDEIMVDEFQDTSDLQNAIIDLISNGHNVFRVGDVKQSIYRFRQAKPSLMRDLMQDPDTKQITLRHNFRSQRSIVEFSNHLFQRLMNIEGCSDSYSEADTVSIGSKRQDEEMIPVEFALIRLDTQDINNEESPEESIDSKLQKANYISKQILKMKQQDPSLAYRDFCILVRSHRDKTVLRQSFDQFNIPYNIDAREGFYQSELAQTILSLVRVMEDPSDSISLLAVLTSNFYNFSDQQLAMLKIRHNSIYEGIQLEYPEILDDLRGFKKIADEKGLNEFFTAISIHHQFYDTLPSSQKANFDYLFETVCSSKCESLDDFLETMEASEDERSSEAISIGRDDDVVTVTTIHQSKGLQYGIVFLWSTSQNYFQDKKNAVIIDDTFKLGIHHTTMPMRARRNTVQRIAAEYHSDIEDAEEFIRLLYVAVTRAEKRLFIVDTLKKDFIYQPVDLALLKQRKGMTSLIINALHGDPLFRIKEVEQEPIEKGHLMQKDYVDELPHLSFVPQLLSQLYTPSSTEFHTLPQLDEASRSSGTSYGTRMHEIMESLPNRMWTKEDLAGLELSEGDKQKILAFSSSKIYKKALTMKIYKEYPFYINTEKERITGTMDFVSVSDTEIILIDYKTDNASIDEIRQRYTPQLNTYKHALNIIYPDHSLHAYAYSFHYMQFIEI